MLYPNQTEPKADSHFCNAVGKTTMKIRCVRGLLGCTIGGVLKGIKVCSWMAVVFVLYEVWNNIIHT